MALHRFWFKFASIEPLSALRLGCGVTAHNYDDAILVMRETLFSDQALPQIESCVEDVDLSSLDQNHVIPNIEPAIWRGVWFPKGYAQP